MIIAPGVSIPPKMLSRHIGIFGATGTGKTTTAAAIVERAPCPVLVLDAKGDLESLGRLHRPWAAQMHVGQLGPDLMARALDLSDAQSGALAVALAWSDDCGRDVASLSDLRDLLGAVVDCAADLSSRYGLITPSSVAAVQRSILRLDRAAPWAFGPAVVDWRDIAGVHVLSCSALAAVPGLYGAMVAAVLDSLYRGLGEIGDVAPGLMVMVDESHLVFDGAAPAVVRRIEQVTRLIRSRGVGLIYVTQSPADLPDAIAGQLATRIQHGLRATTPRAAKAVRAAADMMPGRVTPDQILGLGTGQAIISTPDAAGRPQDGRLVHVMPGRVVLRPVPPETAPEVSRVQPEMAPEVRRVALRPWWRWPVVIGAAAWGLVLLESLLT